MISSFNRIIRIAFFILTASSVNASPVIGRMPFFIKADKAGICLVNKTGKIINFSYVDQFKDLIYVDLEPYNTYTIHTEERIKLVQSNQYQTEYYLEKGDIVTVLLSKSGNAILSISNSLIRNNELDLYRKMSENVSPVFFQLLTFYQNNLKSNYRKVDSIYRADFIKKTYFIDAYQGDHKVSEQFLKNLKIELKHYLYGVQMGIVQKVPVDETYKMSIDSILNEERRTNDVEDQYKDKQFIHACFTYKHRSDNNPDSLFIYAQQELTATMKDEYTFYIVKEELQKNRQSDKWFIDAFLKECKNKAYLKYIQNILDDFKLIAGNEEEPAVIKKEKQGYVDSLKSGKFAVKSENEDFLVTTERQKQSFKSIIKSLIGKVIYIDLWASWCAPCRKEMPSSRKMRQIYSGQPVEFVYLSIDDNINAWKVTNKQEGLDHTLHSYLFGNFAKSQFNKKYQVRLIPRFIIINKQGNVVNADAPRPSDPELKIILDKLITE